jgi:hypothetical protein
MKKRSNKVPEPTGLVSVDKELAFAQAKAIALRVASQRDRLFSVMGVVGCAREAAGDESRESDIQSALDLAHQILDEVCDALDPSHFELLEVSHEEAI